MVNKKRLTKPLPKSPPLFDSKFLPKHERWILPVFLLIGLITNTKTVDFYGLSEMLTPIDADDDPLLHESIHEALRSYAGHVDENNPDNFLAVLSGGTVGLGDYDKIEDVEWFYNEPLSQRYTVDEFAVTKHLFYGKDGIQWYVDAVKHFKKYLPNYDINLFLKLFVATSPLASFGSGLTMSLKAYDLFQKKKSFKGHFLPVVVGMLNDIRKEKFLFDELIDKDTTRRKVRDFYQALSGNTEAVVVDNKLLEAIGLQRRYIHNDTIKHTRPLKTEYDYAEAYVRQLAHATGYEPRQVAAMLWTGKKFTNQKHKSVDISATIKKSLCVVEGK